MGLRELQRSIAKARLKAMGIQHINKIFGLGMSHTREQNLKRTATGRVRLDEIQKQHQPIWRSVTTGSLAKDGYNAQMGIGKKRQFRVAR